MPLDCTNLDDIKTGLSTSALEVVRALDAGRIHFDRRRGRRHAAWLAGCVLRGDP
ncbi:MAG: hypothetical protein MZV65_42830 [Chromatiales bacterium]|nr:hypothetical protein [Chromatiales bacterium]